MTKKEKIKNWQVTVVKTLGWIYLLEFILRQVVYVINSPLLLNIYSFIMWERIISPLTAIGVIVQIFSGIIFIIFNKLYISGGMESILTILLEIIFVIGLFKRWRFSWVILCVTAILALLKHYGVVGYLGLPGAGEYSFNPKLGIINIDVILALLGLYILLKIKNYYR
ncbi:hypothetical protein HYU94_01690 [Candidatus Daviesbacteria bacterium]|nr:hypothetical protein [Candidatus Daviesbacteria bacterium]